MSAHDPSLQRTGAQQVEANSSKSNIVLVGMPGAGKTTVGQQLAARLNLDFIDTDRLIEQQAKCDLQTILNQQGHVALRELEQSVILDHVFSNTVIATGGSAVYGADAMRYLQSHGRVFYLAASIDSLRQRVDNWHSRGIAAPKGQTPESLFAERVPLYQRYADAVVTTDAVSAADVVDQLIALWQVG